MKLITLLLALTVLCGTAFAGLITTTDLGTHPFVRTNGVARITVPPDLGWGFTIAGSRYHADDLFRIIDFDDHSVFEITDPTDDGLYDIWLGDMWNYRDPGEGWGIVFKIDTMNQEFHFINGPIFYGPDKLIWKTNSVVTGVAYDGSGHVTSVTSTNLVYLGR